MIVCLDYQNHSAALPAAGRPQPWFPPHSLLRPLKPTMQPTRRPRGPHCPVLSMEGSGSAPGFHEHQPLYHLGLAISVFCPLPAVPTIPFCHLPGEGNQRI